jgi:Beta-propeller repeat
MQGFLVKLGPTGTILYSTLLGGTNGNSMLNAVAADDQGNAYVTGETSRRIIHTTGLPAGTTVSNGVGGVSAAFLPKFLRLATKSFMPAELPPPTARAAAEIAAARAPYPQPAFPSPWMPRATPISPENTVGLGLPVTPGAFQANGIAAFVAKVNAGGASLAYLTLLCA